MSFKGYGVVHKSKKRAMRAVLHGVHFDCSDTGIERRNKKDGIRCCNTVEGLSDCQNRDSPLYPIPQEGHLQGVSSNGGRL